MTIHHICDSCVDDHVRLSPTTATELGIPVTRRELVADEIDRYLGWPGQTTAVLAGRSTR